MVKCFLSVIASIILFSCQETAQKVEPRDALRVDTEKDFEMYSMSEMSLLMEQMYVDNQRLKERIQRGDTIGEFPNHFMEIHKASMTDDYPLPPMTSQYDDQLLSKKNVKDRHIYDKNSDYEY